MTPSNDEIRLKIAQAKGWKWFGNKTVSDYMFQQGTVTNMPGAAKYLETGEVKFYDIPDWPGSIAAAWELEDEIPVEWRIHYANKLTQVVSQEFGGIDAWTMAHATPRQRCLAWLAWKGITLEGEDAAHPEPRGGDPHPTD